MTSSKQIDGRRLCRLFLLSVAVLFAASPIDVRAQSGPSAATSAASAMDNAGPEAEATQAVPPAKSLLSIIKDGGYLMLPLLACSFTLLVFAFERAISLRGGRVIPRPFVKRFLHQLESGQLDLIESHRALLESRSC